MARLVICYQPICVPFHWAVGANLQASILQLLGDRYTITILSYIYGFAKTGKPCK